MQALLRPDETLIVFLDIPSAGKLPEETLAWAVTNREARWINVSLGSKALAERVAKLRCGLDRDGQWKRSVHRWEAKGEHCRALKPDGLTDSEPLPFDLGVAHELYTKLLAPLADLTKGKSLIIVPSGPLTSLPFHVLVTEAPKGTALQEQTPTSWLALKQPVSVLPSVGSLQALRKLPPSQARDPYIAFGNPLLDGGAPNSMSCSAAISHRRRAPSGIKTRSCSSRAGRFGSSTDASMSRQPFDLSLPSLGLRSTRMSPLSPTMPRLDQGLSLPPNRTRTYRYSRMCPPSAVTSCHAA